MTAMDRARVLILAGVLLVGAAAAEGTVWAASITCTVAANPGRGPFVVDGSVAARWTAAMAPVSG